MSPEQLGALTTVLSLMRALSSWPFGVLAFMLVVGPWVLSLMLYYSSRKRFETVVGMYERNVALVKKYENIANDLHSVVVLNTEGMTKALDAIKTNQYCPMVRLEKLAKGTAVV